VAFQWLAFGLGCADLICRFDFGSELYFRVTKPSGFSWLKISDQVVCKSGFYEVASRSVIIYFDIKDNGVEES